MSTETEQLHLRATDTVVTVREQLAKLRGRRVLVVWPDEGRVLTRKLDIVLMQREAYRRAIQLALVTQDPHVSAHANDLNISSFESIEASETSRWKRGRQKVFLPRYHKPSADLEPEDLAFIASRLERRNGRSPWRNAFERLLVLTLLFGVVGAAFYISLPYAVIQLSLLEEEVIAVIDITADRKAKTVNLDKGVIPAQTVRAEVETTATIPTSGTFWLDSVTAAGVVTFTNLGEERVTIPQNTTLGTSAGEPILFETAADVVVPAGIGQSVDATVEARSGYRGSVGNVRAGMINTVIGALAESVSVINLAPAAGGGNRSVKVVDAEDKARLLDSVRIQLQSLAFEKMSAGLSDSQIIIIESIKIEDELKDWTSFSAEVGTMTSELSLTMRAVVSALAMDERYGRQVALEQLKANVTADRQILADSISYARGPFVLGRSDGQVSFAATSNATTVGTLDIDRLRENLAGKSIDEAKALLTSLDEVSSLNPPSLTIYPQGLRQLPLLPIRIELRVREAA